VEHVKDNEKSDVNLLAPDDQEHDQAPPLKAEEEPEEEARPEPEDEDLDKQQDDELGGEDGNKEDEQDKQNKKGQKRPAPSLTAPQQPEEGMGEEEDEAFDPLAEEAAATDAELLSHIGPLMEPGAPQGDALDLGLDEGTLALLREQLDAHIAVRPTHNTFITSAITFANPTTILIVILHLRSREHTAHRQHRLRTRATRRRRFGSASRW
jgi:hypothetical protein